MSYCACTCVHTCGSLLVGGVSAVSRDLEAWSSCLLLSRDRKWALSASGSYLSVGERMGGGMREEGKEWREEKSDPSS